MSKYIFDNSNLNESYAGVTTPLTYTFIKKMYEGVYVRFCHAMGVPKKIIENNHELYSNMIEFVGGRLYYNLINWYKFVSFLPGYRFNRKYFEQMLGVNKEYFYEKTSDNKIGYLRSIYQHFIVFKDFLVMGNLVKKFRSDFKNIYEEINKIDLSKLSTKELVKLLHLSKENLLMNWWIPIANDFAVMVSTGLLRKLLVLWTDDDGTLFNQMVSPKKHSVLAGEEFKKLINKKGTLEFRDEIINYVNKFGERVPGELKLESTNFRDEPAILEAFVNKQK
jgi:pyruvate,water dikinase